MVKTPVDGRRIFIIPFQAHDPNVFERAWQKGLDERLASAKRTLHVPLAGHHIEMFRDTYATEHAPEHRYNDIAGFAEGYWDGGTRILVDCWVRGNGRTRYGQRVQATRPQNRLYRNQFYLYVSMGNGGMFADLPGEEDRKQAVLDALDAVERIVKDLKCYVDLSEERRLVRHIDFTAYLQPEPEGEEPSGSPR